MRRTSVLPPGKTLAQGRIHSARAGEILWGPRRLSAAGANGNSNAVMDGDIDGFINAYLTASATGELKK